MKIIVLIILIFFSLVVRSQNKSIDSLLKVLQTQKEDTAKVNTLNALAIKIRNSNTDTSLYFSTKALNLATRLEYEFGIADAKRGISAIYASHGKFEEGIKYGNDALDILNKLLDSTPASEKNKVIEKIGQVYQILGHNNSSKGNFPEGLKNTLLSLKIKEQIGDKNEIGAAEYNLGNIYTSLHNYPEALKHLETSLKISKEMGIKSDIAYTTGTIGWVYLQEGNYSEALKHCTTAATLAEETKDKLPLAEIYNSLGVIYYHKGNYGEALKYDFKSLKLYEESGIYQVLPDVYNNIGIVYTKQKKYTDATKYLNKALTFSKQIGSLELIKLSYENWATLACAQGNYKKALEHYKNSIVIRDSLFNKENAKKLVQAQMQYDFDKKEAATKAEQDKKQALANAEISKQKIVRNFSFAGIFVVLLVGGYGFYRFRINKKIENQQSLLNERLRISRELHDDMGSTLSSISVYSEVAKDRAAKNESETEVLQKIGTASRELIDKMSDIVWSLNPNNENFEQLKNRMMAFAAMMLTPKGIQFEFDIDDEIKNTAIAPEQRKNIFLIYKEAINNIVKYSEATLVKVKVKVKENKLSLEILDNGKGFDTSNVVAYNGNGIKNMRARAEEIRAMFNVTSRINEGVRIELAFNI